MLKQTSTIVVQTKVMQVSVNKINNCTKYSENHQLFECQDFKSLSTTKKRRLETEKENYALYAYHPKRTHHISENITHYSSWMNI